MEKDMITINNELVEALLADSAYEKLKEELNLFGQFVGSWKFDWIGYRDDGSIETEKGGEWIFGWILGGRAIQDVWILPGRDKRHLKGSPEGEYGTTVRLYNVETKKWDSIWIGPIRNRFNRFIAEKVGDEIVLSSERSEEVKRKWIFSEINSNSFRWREEVLQNESLEWKLIQEFACIRD